MEYQNTNGESKIRKVIFNEVSLFIALIGCISGVIFWVANPQKALEIEIVRLQTRVESNETIAAELQTIKNNDLHEIQLRLDRIEARQIEEMKAISRLEALLSR